MGSVSQNKPTSLDFASAFSSNSNRFDLLAVEDFVSPIIPFETLRLLHEDPSHHKKLCLDYIRTVPPAPRPDRHAFQEFNDTITNNWEEAYHANPLQTPYLTNTRNIVVTQPRAASPFFEKISNYLNNPEAPYSAHIAPQRLGSDQVYSYLYNPSTYDKQRRYLNTGIMQYWMMARRRSLNPPGAVYNMHRLKVYKYAQLIACVEFPDQWGINRADWNLIKSSLPYYYDKAKLMDILTCLDHPFPQLIIDSYLYLAGCSIVGNLGPPANVIFIDVSNAPADPRTALTTPTELGMLPDLFFALLTSQHGAKDTILTRVLYPTSFPAVYHIRDNTGEVPAHNNVTPDIFSVCTYNPFDHLCYLMDSVNDARIIPVILYRDDTVPTDRIFSMVQYFMRALTVSFLGLPFPRVNIPQFPIRSGICQHICAPFIQAGNAPMIELRWRFIPWELMIAFGGKLATKISLGGLLYPPERGQNDAEMKENQNVVNGRLVMVPKNPSLPYVLPTAYAVGNGNYTYRGSQSLTDLVHPTLMIYESFIPHFINERRGEGICIANESVADARSSLQGFRNPVTQNYSKGVLGFLDISKVER